MKRMIRLKEVLRITGLSRSTVYNYMSDGVFPAQVKIGYRSVAWREVDIQQWLDGCIVV